MSGVWHDNLKPLARATDAGRVRRLIVAGTLCVALAAPAAALGDRAERDYPCSSKRAQTVAASDLARVVMLPGQGDAFACARPLRRGDGATFLGAAGSSFDLTIAGRFIAYHERQECDKYMQVCIAPIAYVIDAWNGTELGRDGNAKRRERRFPGATDIAVWRDGSVVTIERYPAPTGDPFVVVQGYNVVLRGPRGTRLLDTGTDIDPRSLGAFGRHTQWWHGSQPRLAAVLPARVTGPGAPG